MIKKTFDIFMQRGEVDATDKNTEAFFFPANKPINS